MKYTLCLLTLLLGGCISHYSNYQYDNGDDYVSEGTVRIVNDDNGKSAMPRPTASFDRTAICFRLPV